jgi:uncharacterized protein YaaQ
MEEGVLQSGNTFLLSCQERVDNMTIRLITACASADRRMQSGQSTSASAKDRRKRAQTFFP